MKVKERIELVLDLGNYIVSTGSTIRATAEHFGLPKSNVHYAVTKSLPKIDPILYDDVLDVIELNFSARSVRGGKARWKARKENAL